MIVQELKEICKLIGTNGLIEEFKISQDGHVLGIDTAKTFCVDLKYNTTLEKDIYIPNIKGVIEIISQFKDNTPIQILDNRLHIEEGTKFANIVLMVVEDNKLTLPKLTNDDFKVIVENIGTNIINNLSKLKTNILINELYHFYMDDNKLIYRVGIDEENNIGDFIGIATKSSSDVQMKFTMNIPECFKNITTPSKILMSPGRLIQIECQTEKYNLKYCIAPYLDE